MYEYRARLVKLVDGDTMHVEVDLGMDIHTFTSVRLYGINTPEMRSAEGPIAKQFAAQWLLEHTDEWFILRTHKDKRGKYGRYLGTILSLEGSNNLNEELIKSNNAVPYFG